MVCLWVVVVWEVFELEVLQVWPRIACNEMMEVEAFYSPFPSMDWEQW